MQTLAGTKRNITGKKVESIRKKGGIPAVLYGKGMESQPLSIDYSAFLRAWREAGESSIIEIDIGGEKHRALIADVQFHPIKNMPIHVDFHAVRMDEKITASVPVVFTGEAPAVKNREGVLVKVLHEVEVEALPMSLPNEIPVDISSLEHVDDRITVADITLGEGVEIQADSSDVVALINALKEEEEEPEEEEKSIEDIEATAEKQPEEGEESTNEEPGEQKPQEGEDEK